MAGDWIKMRVNLRTHPKVVRMASALLADRFRVIGALHAVWCMADEHTEDGTLPGYTLAAVDESIGWPGFGAAMKAVDWILENAQGIVIPEFETHNGASAKRRAQEADRKRGVRNLSASDADKKRTREEKRRGCTPGARDARAPTEGLDAQAPERQSRRANEVQEPGTAVAVVKPVADTEARVAAALTWEGYSVAYAGRYGVDPTRNARVNSMIAQFVQRVGREDAPAIAGFFVGHQQRFYVEKLHPVSLMLADAEKLATEWARHREGRAPLSVAPQSDLARSLAIGQEKINRDSQI